MNYAALAAELTAGHPDTGAYDDADAQLAANQINAVNRKKNKTHMSASEIFEAIDEGEYDALTEGAKRRVDLLLGLGDSIAIEPGTRARTWLLGMFGGGTATRATLVAIVQEDASRAQELGFGRVRGGDVEKARAI